MRREEAKAVKEDEPHSLPAGREETVDEERLMNKTTIVEVRWNELALPTSSPNEGKHWNGGERVSCMNAECGEKISRSEARVDKLTLNVRPAVRISNDVGAAITSNLTDRTRKSMHVHV